MKKQLVLAAGLAVLATPAFASKARLAALGEDDNGSFYIQDNRNIFLNASEINNNKDFVTYELEAGGAEGGFARTAGNMVYGAQLGRSVSYNAAATQIADGTVTPMAATNALDLFLGGDAGIKWGVQLTYSSQKDDSFDQDVNPAPGVETPTEAQTDVMDLAVGVSQGAWSAYAKAGLTGNTEHKDTDIELDRKSDLEIGGSYNLNGYVLYGQYAMSSYELKTAAPTEEYDSTSLDLGVARQEKLNDKAVLFTKLNYGMDTFEIKDGDETNDNGLTATVGLEFDAASWLTLRGSVAQQILVNEEETKIAGGATDKATKANTTIVAAGASLKFGDMSVDGMIGNTTGTQPTAANSGVINTDNLMTRVSMTYRF